MTSRSLGTCLEQASCPSEKIQVSLLLGEQPGSHEDPDIDVGQPVHSSRCLQFGCWELGIHLYFLFICSSLEPSL